MHADLLSMSWRAHLMAVYDSWQIPTNQWLGHLVYAIDLWLLKIFGFPLTEIYSLEFGLEQGSFTASVGDWLTFTEKPHTNALLFFLKLPHLIADTFIFYLLYCIFKTHKNRLLVLASWWLNPVNLYAFYIFARHDAITLLAVLFAIIFTARNKIWQALISLFAAIQIRVQPLLYVPIFVAAIWKQRESLRKVLQQVVIAGVIIALYLGAMQLLPTNTELITMLSRTPAVPEAVGVPTTHAQQVLSTFLGVYAVLGFSYFLFVKVPEAWRTRLKQLAAVLVVLMSFYFALNDFYPHYFVWLSLFVSLALASQPKIFWPYAGAVVGFLGMGVTATNNFSINQNLFMPVSNTIFRSPQITTLLQARGIEPALLFSASKLLLSISLLILAFMVIQKELLPSLEISRKQLAKLLPMFLAVVVLGAPTTARALTVPVLQTENANQEQFFTTENTIIGQQFTSPVGEFGSIEVRLNVHANRDSEPVYFRIKEADADGWLYEAEYNRADFYTGYYYPFGFPTITNAENKEYYFELEYPEPTKAPLSVYTNNEGTLDFTVLANDTALFKELLVEDVQRKVAAQKPFFIAYSVLLLITGGLFFTTLFLKDVD